MREHIVTIEPTGNADTFLTFTYLNKPDGMNYSLLTNGEVVMTKTNEPAPEQRDQIIFSRNNKRHTFRWDGEDPMHKGSIRRAFLLQHASVKCPTFSGNMNLVNPRFIMTDHYTEEIREYERVTNVAATTNRVLAMEGSEMADVLYYYGLNASGMSLRQMILKLIAPQGVAVISNKAQLSGGGILFEYNETYDRAQEFNSIFAEKDEDISRIINIKKAVAVGIITVEGETYKFNGEVLGGSIDGVLGYYKSNPERYDRFLKPQIEQRVNEVHAVDIDQQPEKEIQKSFIPVVAKTMAPAQKKFTQGDLEAVLNQIAANDKNPDMRKDKIRFAQVQTTLKMQERDIKKYLKEQADQLHEKNHGTFQAIDKLTKQGNKAVAKQVKEKENAQTG